MESEKPNFRPAKFVSENEANTAISSGDPELIAAALIDGSRCFDDQWTMKHAPIFLEHPDSSVRWAAVFALDQARAGFVSTLRDDFELLFRLQRLIVNEPDAYVRNLVATLFIDVIAMLIEKSLPPTGTATKNYSEC